MRLFFLGQEHIQALIQMGAAQVTFGVQSLQDLEECVALGVVQVKDFLEQIININTLRSWLEHRR